jgi:hypothetical protein
MHPTTRFAPLAAAVLLAIAAAPAWAQDYVVSSVSGQYASPPSSGTTNLITSTKSRDDVAFTISSANVPFPIFYFGQYYTSLAVCSNGYVQFGATTPTTTKFASNFPLSAKDDGICAAAWDDLDGFGQSSVLTYWTDGSAPNRRFIVGWSGWEQASNTGSLAFQIQFYEASGRIQMAYASGWSGQTRAKAVGIDAVGADTRYVTPDGSSLYYNTPTDQPANDWRFDPRITNFNGRVLFDRYVVDLSGIGNTYDPSVPLAGLAVAVRNAAGTTVASGFTDTDGNFAVQGWALVATENGSLAVTSRSPACNVSASVGGAPYAVAIASNVSFGPTASLGTITIGSGSDPSGAARAPLNVANTIQSARNWCAARTTDTIPPVDVLYDTASSAVTSYTPPATSNAVLRVGAAAANPDPWDSAVIRKTYARHVLGAIAARPTTTIATAFDSVTDAENAFAEGFGYYLNAAITGNSKYFDGTSSGAATQIDLEGTVPVSPKGPDVAAWVALALYDLTDGANESWDTFDGVSSGVDKVFLTADSLTSPVTASTFYAAWGGLGFDGPAIARDFIHHGLIGDDADEPNDSASEVKLVAPFGFRRTGRVLNLYNEDWYGFSLASPTDALTVDVVYDRSTITAGVTVQILNSAGSVLVSGSPLVGTNAIRAVMGAVGAGSYRARVVHDSGARVDDYTLQVFAKLTLSSDAFPPWTVGRPYSLPVTMTGGVPAYALSVDIPYVPPPGLVFDGPGARVTGTPTAAGTYTFALTARDTCTPKNAASVNQVFVVNPALTFQFGEFFALPAGRALDRPAPYSGGTAPFTFTTTQGSFPAGIDFAPGEFRFVGTPAAPGGTHFKLEASDVAGSTATTETTGVVCAQIGESSPLGADSSACGFWFDAVQGTSVSIAVKTAKKQPKRVLRVVMVGSDGSTTIPAPAKGGKGKASVSKFLAPSTGRYFCIVASDAGPATALTATGKLVLPKKGAGDTGENVFVPGHKLNVEIGVLAGATVTFSAKPDKTSGLEVRTQYLMDPAGTAIAFPPGEVVESKGGISFKHVFATSGTWTIVLGAKNGPSGTFKYTYTVKQPKGGVYSED